MAEDPALDRSLADFPTSAPVVGVGEVSWSSFDGRRPLVIRGAMRRALEKWTDEWLLQRFGSGLHRVTLDARPAIFGAFEKHVGLAEYLDPLTRPDASNQAPEYLFQTWLERHFDAAADLLEDLDVPEPILSLGIAGKWRFFIGPAGSGTLPHHHHHAINALARGRKRWAIYAGASPRETEQLLEEGYRDYGSGSRVEDWFIRECPELRSRRNVRLWECAQGPGDLVYIPESFIHAIVNLEPVVGFGAELFPPREYFSRGPARRRSALGGRGPARRGTRIV
jgi:hypothetical protein